MNPSTPRDASAAVSALYFCVFLMAVFNVRYTGFRLYVPIGIAGLVRGVSYATRAAFLTTGDIAYMAASRALAAVGLGINIAMCACFLVIWLRNANPHHQPSRAPRLMTPLCKILVACVIMCGPMLGVIGAALMFGKPNDKSLVAHGTEIRKASASGFLAVEGLIFILISFAAANWVLGSRRQQQQQRGDGLILLLLFSNLLLLWAAAANVASITHPYMILDPNLHFPVQTLPELLVAFIWSWPALVAKIALGARFQEWRRQQQQQQGVAGSDSYDAEAIADPSVSVKSLELQQQQQR